MTTKGLLIPYDSRGEFQSHREHPVPSSHLFHPTEEEELALGRGLFSCSTVCKHIFQIIPFQFQKVSTPNEARCWTNLMMYFLLLIGKMFISLKGNGKSTGQ